MCSAAYLIKAATTQWRARLRGNNLSLGSFGRLQESKTLTPEYWDALGRGLKRGPTWEEILGRAGGVHTDVAKNYAEAAQRFPANMKPVNIIGTGGESLAVKMRDGNVMKMTISPKPVQSPRSFDAPVLDRGGVAVTKGHVPVQWHVQPKLNIMSEPPAPTTFRHVKPSDWMSKDTVIAGRYARRSDYANNLHGDEISAERFIRKYTRGGMMPTDVYPQGVAGMPNFGGKPKVQQFGRTSDGKVVLADRGAISEHASVPAAGEAGAFNGPQMLSTAVQEAKSTGLKPGTAYTSQELESR